jgi:GNAT superfamily N-acetyltransferase
LDGEGIAEGQVAVEKLGGGLDLARFDCGCSELNDWLLHSAWPGKFMRFADTYVVRDGRTVMGYHALGVETFAANRFPETAGREQLPQSLSAMILMCLAVDKQHQKRSLGRSLLRDAITRFAREAENQRVKVLLVRARNEAVRQLYISCGFTPLPAENHILLR